MSEYVTVKRELLARLTELMAKAYINEPAMNELRAVLAQEADEDCENCDGTGGVKVSGGSDSCPVCKGSGVSAPSSPPAPVSAVLPEREWGSPYADGWNACLDKFKELNQ
jgi:hypothetical protein